jgi:hypothetical protein
MLAVGRAYEDTSAGDRQFRVVHTVRVTYMVVALRHLAQHNAQRV